MPVKCRQRKRMSDFVTLLVAVLACGSITTPVGAWLGNVLAKQKSQVEIEKLRAELRAQLAEVRSGELDNVRKANDILVESIVTPLKKEISTLRKDVDKFRKAVEKIPLCSLADSCPVSRELQKCESQRDIDEKRG